ncbi:peptide/nickel transport system substrate-binding protein [Lipingzhangella halophila]|uniref:Peptide/nickel transport system substrate-binding protein n=1 Tax=Lipingzhangella halophila TaxID=1783352 RepID=A0A7W7W3S2_9ACTN|nr:ABC transporter substrate-binding protein [Lipingzhangella halophila]MBB4933342.1 peptide/nickel transport system substrate-binding protein [Lipingzhangella halophila]
MSTVALPRLSAPIMACVLVLGTGCSAGSGDDSSLSIGFTAEPASLDFTTDDGVAIPEVLLTNVYEGLVELAPDGGIQPALADSWEVSDDRRTYTFELNSDVTFSNGESFTAEDVKFSIERAQEEWTISLADVMDVVDTVEVVSPTEVTVELSEPSNAWLYAMTTRVGAMFTPTGVDNLDTEPVGTGPYEVADWTRGDSITLQRRADYWGEQPATETVEFRYFDDENALTNAMLTGDLDVISALAAAESLDQFTGDDQYQVIEGTTNGEVVLGLNHERDALSDRRVRQAIAHAIDQEALLETVWAGHGELIGSMVPPTDPWYEDLSEVHPHDPDRAEDLLEEADAEDLTLDFPVPNLPYAMDTARVVQSDLEDVGITAEIEPLEFPAVWLEDVFTGHDYDMTVIQHSEGRDMPTFADPDYYWGYDNEDVQDLLAEADRSGGEEQTEHMAEAAELLAEDVAAVFLYLQPMLIVADSGVEGLPDNRVSESFDVTPLSRS